jgi:hypothetical protein
MTARIHVRVLACGPFSDHLKVFNFIFRLKYLLEVDLPSHDLAFFFLNSRTKYL